MRNITCFVASAFGKTDVDKIYKNIIYPTLKRMNIKCHRVDKIEHNEDIDDKIIELINKCDFCIADLTYARPSVYYESGYFNGLGKEVIFTVRQDHFSPKEKDIQGNERIHFDLQMKNIIKWNKPECSSEFTRKLKSRICLITKPIQVKLKGKEKLAEARERFKRISSTSKLDIMEDLILSKMRKNKWTPIKPEFDAMWKPKNYLCFLKGKNICAVFITASVTKQEFKFVLAGRVAFQNKKYFPKENGICHIVIISYRKIPESRIEDLYPQISKMPNCRHTYDGDDSNWSMLNKQTIKTFYHFVSDIKSEPEYKDLIEVLLREIEST